MGKSGIRELREDNPNQVLRDERGIAPSLGRWDTQHTAEGDWKLQLCHAKSLPLPLSLPSPYLHRRNGSKHEVSGQGIPWKLFSGYGSLLFLA